MLSIKRIQDNMPDGTTRPMHKRGLWLMCGLVVAGLLSLGGCAGGPQVMVDHVSNQHYSPTSLVQILYHSPNRNYQVIAHLEVQGVAGQSDAQLLAALQDKAAALGAEAIIVHEKSTVQPPGITYSPTGGQFATSTGQSIPSMSAVAIRYNDN